MITLGVIGYGARIRHMIQLMQRLYPETEVIAITDVRNDEIRQEMLNGDGDREPPCVDFYDDADEMLRRTDIDGVMIGTRCSLHAQQAIKVLRTNLPLFLEKPVATTMEDLVAIRDASEESLSEVVVGFPLRVTPLARLAKEIIDSGKIGTVEHAQMWNNVSYGAVYYQDWYRDENETQGLWLQKATHDFDYVNHLLGTQPRWVCAVDSKRVFKGDRPANLRCDECHEWDSCLESPYHTVFTKHEAERVQASDAMCCFAVDTGNQDSGSAIVEYESGMHVAYSQNFFARKAAGSRGVRLFGYKGTLEFDWSLDELKVYLHHTPRIETYKTEPTGGSHGGGDLVLADSFARVIGERRHSAAPLSAGILSALMCLKAKESARTHTFQDICFPDSATLQNVSVGQQSIGSSHVHPTAV